MGPPWVSVWAALGGERGGGVGRVLGAVGAHCGSRCRAGGRVPVGVRGGCRVRDLSDFGLSRVGVCGSVCVCFGIGWN